jgi:heterodisulfide reductase subunit C
MVLQILFLIIAAAAIALFSINLRKIIRNIKLGRPEDRSDKPSERLTVMLKLAFGQSKMANRPVAFILHLFVYIGFVIINLEVLEIIIDGIFGTHRIFAEPLGSIYNLLIASFEVLAALVLIGVIVFFARRNIVHVKRFSGTEMVKWPKSDANIILIVEVLLMGAFLTMNAADSKLQQLGTSNYLSAGSFPVSSFLVPLLADSESTLIAIERFSWWFHIIGIFAFLNYLPYSKHLHIILAFPNTYYSNLEPKGELTNMASVSNEVKAMLDPSFSPEPIHEGGRFGAKDISDLSWKSLLDAYTCTECGRCTSVCPANITGKLLSPRKIMMDTRDRMEEVGKNIDKYGKELQDGKSLLDSYITREEIWACTTCNACTDACPINIDPLAVIVELRRFAVMEESQAPGSLNSMFGNVENNGAPWKYAAVDRMNWAEEN